MKQSGRRAARSKVEGSAPAARPASSSRSQTAPQVSRWFLFLTVWCTGHTVMVVEILGAKIIGPYFGVSLYIWTAIIAVTLAALTLGYWGGGWLADRWGSPNALFTLIALAGVSLLVVVFVKNPVLSASGALGLRMGALTGAFALFTVPLLLLGAVAPLAVKLQASTLHGVGGTVGRLYAISTLGSVIGSIDTGFFLAPHLSAPSILALAAAMLLVLSASFWALRRNPRAAVAILLIPAIWLPLRSAPAREYVRNGVKWKVVFERPSPYGGVQVLDVVRGSTTNRIMLNDGIGQSAIDVANGLSLAPYTYGLELLSLRYQPEAKRALIIGLGAGLLPKSLHARGIISDVVEINPVVVEVARQYFGYRGAGGELAIEDARVYINRARQQYDLVSLDAFVGEIAPSHLLTQQMFSAIKKLMNAGGVLTLNLPGFRRVPRSFAAASLQHTLQQVFQHVDVYFIPFSAQPRDKDFGSLLFAAYDHAPPEISAPPRLEVHPTLRDATQGILASRFHFSTEGAITLTDDYNPIDYFDLAAKETYRRRMQEVLGAGLLLR